VELRYMVCIKQRLLPHCWPYGIWPWKWQGWWRGESRLICHPVHCCQDHRESAKKISVVIS
jgi:hypothetical protein